jgi:hypothetical protein
LTHNERVLELLSDGEPHSHHEGYRLNVMLHSRVADLRKQGHEIACWREGDSYFYRLHTAAGRPDASFPGGCVEVAGLDGKLAPRPSDSPQAGAGSPEELVPALPVQLSIEEAA